MKIWMVGVFLGVLQSLRKDGCDDVSLLIKLQFVKGYTPARVLFSEVLESI